MKRKLQVFISSTYSDLIEERQAAVAAILKSGHIPAGMELFTAGDKSQKKTIERWIDESDVFMLILGGRYGSIEPTTGLSYTELEYDYAVSRGKPTFAVVIADSALEARAKAKAGSIETTNQKKLTEFRAKVLTNISSFFSDPKDIKLCVHESLSDYSASPDLKGWLAAEEVPDTKSLQDEIKQLREENASLTTKFQKLERAASHQSKKHSDADAELVDVLRAIEITVPGKLAGQDKERKMDLFTLVYNNRDTLISGVTNAMNASEAESFFFYKIVPKLQAYGLAENQKEPGYKFRRASLNKKGQTLFADIEKKILLAKANAAAATLKSNSESADLTLTKGAGPQSGEKAAKPAKKKKKTEKPL